MLKWVFGADTKPFRSGLKQMRDEVKGFSGSIKGNIAGALGLGALAAGFKSLMDQFGRIDDLSQRLGMSAESIQRIGHVATLSGADLEILAKGLTTLTRNLAEAENGSEGLADAARVLGIDIARFKQLSPESQMMELSRGLVSAKDSGQGLSAVMTLLGKSGVELVPMLLQGPEALDKALKDVTVTSGNTVRSIAALGDAVDNLKRIGQIGGGIFVQVFNTVGSIVGAVIGTILAEGLAVAKALAGAAYDVGFAISSALSGDMSGANKSLDNIEKRFVVLGKSLKRNLKNGAKIARDEVKQIWDTTEITPSKNIDLNGIEAAKEKARLEAEAQLRLTELKKEVIKLEEESRLRQLSIEEKIAELREKKAKAGGVAYIATGEEGETARRDELLAAAELVKLEKERSDEIARTAEEVARRNEEVARETQAMSDRVTQAKLDGEKIDQHNRMANMTTAEKIAELSKDQKKATIESFEAGLAGDVIKSLEKANEAKSIGGEIAALKTSPVTGPTILAEDLRKIGGGGMAALTTNPQQGVETRLDRVVKVLEEIKRDAKPVPTFNRPSPL